MELHFTYDDCFDYLVAESIDSQLIRRAAEDGKKLRIKFGIDPTSPNIHLGRAIAVWRLRAFQEMGHEIHLVIGDFTGQVGDTSDKETERPMLSEEDVHRNMEEYERQLWMILNPDKKDQIIFDRNSTWLAPLSFAKISQLADAFSVNQFIKRELIARRLEEGSRVSLREMLYPVMQGYDSVMIEANIELGGTDQRFNLLAGRTLQEQAGQPAQTVIMHGLINGLDGRKMSSSWGNVISLLDSPQDKFGKMMRVLDSLLVDYLNIFPQSARPFSADELKQRLDAGENPRDLKMIIAWQLVALYHGEEEANRVKEQYQHEIIEGQQPEEMKEVHYNDIAIPDQSLLIIEALVKTGLASSNSDARRLIDQKGVRKNEQTVESYDEGIPGDTATILQVGKRNYVRINP